MEELDEKYYHGFEGEPEIIFSLVIQNGEKRELGIWIGYFDKIMRQIKPKEGRWTSLAYFYHLYIGWYDESPWLIENLVEAYEQLNEIDHSNLTSKDKEVLETILNLLIDAIDNNFKVFISYD